MNSHMSSGVPRFQMVMPGFWGVTVCSGPSPGRATGMQQCNDGMLVADSGADLAAGDRDSRDLLSCARQVT